MLAADERHQKDDVQIEMFDAPSQASPLAEPTEVGELFGITDRRVRHIRVEQNIWAEGTSTTDISEYHEDFTDTGRPEC